MTERGWVWGEPDLFGHRKRLGFGDGVVEVRWIPKVDADELVRRGHYSGSVAWASSEHFGVYVAGSLVGALQYGPAMNPASGAKIVAATEPDQWLELNRLWIADGQPLNTSSRVVAYSVKLLRVHRPRLAWIQTFADERCGKAGGLYQAASFLYLGSHRSTFLELDGEWFHKSMIGRAGYDKRGWWSGPKIARLNANIDRATRHVFEQYRYFRPLTKWARRNLQIAPKPYPKPAKREAAA